MMYLDVHLLEENTIYSEEVPESQETMLYIYRGSLRLITDEKCRDGLDKNECDAFTSENRYNDIRSKTHLPLDLGKFYFSSFRVGCFTMGDGVLLWGLMVGVS